MIKGSRQVAALPVRRDEAGALQVLLVTSRETKRWVIPKGWPWPKRADHRAAAEEAREEAGVRGKPRKNAIGSYDYDKRLKDGSRPVHVDIYLLVVTRELDKWPERRERTRSWFSPEAAADAVGEPELQRLLRRLPEVVEPILAEIRAEKQAKKARKTKGTKVPKTDKPAKKKTAKKSKPTADQATNRNPD